VSNRAATATIATEFITAFAERDAPRIQQLLADDVHFQSPLSTLDGRQSVVAAIIGFAQAVDSVDIIAALGDETSAMIMYDMHTGPFGTLRTVDYLTLRDGAITSDFLVFDTHPVRSGTSATEE